MIRWRVHRFGDNIDTDAIIPASCANVTHPAVVGQHRMENIDPGFVKRISPGDIIIAGSNFGCGSSREIAPLAIRGAGITGVIAKSFARGFFRNAVNVALPVFACPAAVERTEENDSVETGLTRGEIRNLTRNTIFKAASCPDFVRELVSASGLVGYGRRLIAQAGGSSGVIRK